MPSYRGSCHCGAVTFEITTEFSEFTRCDCSLCRKKNAVMTKVHEDDFKLLKGEDRLGLYQWNTRTAKHYFCKSCGIYTFHRKRIDPACFGVNVYCLDGANLAGVPIVEVDGQSMSTVAPDGR